MNTKKWITKDGRKIRIKNMDDQHLRNTIKILERQLAYKKLTLPFPSFNGEMAQMCAEADFDRFLESDVGDHFPIYDDLVEELHKRGENKWKLK